MKVVLFVSFLILLFPMISCAEVFTWEDGDGIHFVDDASKVPKKYRHKVKKRDDIMEAPKESKKNQLVNNQFNREGFERALEIQTKFHNDGYNDYYYSEHGLRKFNSDGGGFFVPVTVYNRNAAHAGSNQITINCKGRLDDPTDLGLSKNVLKILKNRLCSSE